MNARLAVLILTVTAAVFFTAGAGAAVVFGPGSKAKYVAPGEEEMSGTAAELFHIGQEAEKRGDLKRAIKAYKGIVRRHEKGALAPGAAFRAAELYERLHDYSNASGSYNYLVLKYPSSPYFDDAIEGLFRIGEAYLNGKKTKILGISMGSSVDRSIEIFANIIRTAPYGKYTARAQFDIGLAREKQKVTDAAISAYQAVVEKFPNDRLAPSAQYQIGYLWMNVAKAGTQDIDATAKARTAFEDFLFRYPNNEKAAQARAYLEFLSRKQTTSAFDIAKYYDKQKHYRAAVIYYNEVIRQQPGSTESERAKKRIDQIRAKVGDKALVPVAESLARTDKKEQRSRTPAVAHDRGPGGDSTTSSAPLPPAETDTSLPPAASLLPDTTTAPSTSTSSGSSLDGIGSPSSEAAASPDATPPPAP
ncbi:MAG TPA: outer membrane protein assembly factor BamD [Chthoniobacterales bacterium]|nr:outer membrane protein assembly factor BamD [Chthoniobacterales bacterium]